MATPNKFLLNREIDDRGYGEWLLKDPYQRLYGPSNISVIDRGMQAPQFNPSPLPNSTNKASVIPAVVSRVPSIPSGSNSPFSTFADPNSFLGRPFLPALGQAISDFGQTAMRAITPQTTTPPSTLAGVTIPPVGAAAPNLNPFPFLASLNPLGNRPLIRNDYGERPVATPQVVPQLPSGATSYGASRTTQATPVPLPTFPSQASVGSSMVSAVAPTLPTAPQPSPIIPTPPSDGRFKFTFQGAEPMSERRGTIMATPEQLTNLASRQTAYEGRTPEQQAALLANIRKTGAGIRKNIASNQINSFVNRPEPTPTYTTFSRAPIKAPTNMFGQPIQSWANIYAKSSEENESALARMGRGTRGFGV